MSLFINIFFPVIIFFLAFMTFAAWRRDRKVKDFELQRKMDIFFPRDRFSLYKVFVTIAFVLAVAAYLLIIFVK